MRVFPFATLLAISSAFWIPKINRGDTSLESAPVKVVKYENSTEPTLGQTQLLSETAPSFELPNLESFNQAKIVLSTSTAIYTALTTTILTVTKCESDSCSHHTLTTGVTIVTITESDTVTEYTTYCPLTSTSTFVTPTTIYSSVQPSESESSVFESSVESSVESSGTESSVYESTPASS
ncbi:hypothetical protein G210_5320, partial [Candida maltosa Xu316]